MRQQVADAHIRRYRDPADVVDRRRVEVDESVIDEGQGFDGRGHLGDAADAERVGRGGRDAVTVTPGARMRDGATPIEHGEQHAAIGNVQAVDDAGEELRVDRFAGRRGLGRGRRGWDRAARRRPSRGGRPDRGCGGRRRPRVDHRGRRLGSALRRRGARSARTRNRRQTECDDDGDRPRWFGARNVRVRSPQHHPSSVSAGPTGERRWTSVSRTAGGDPNDAHSRPSCARVVR